MSDLTELIRNALKERATATAVASADLHELTRQFSDAISANTAVIICGFTARSSTVQSCVTSMLCDVAWIPVLLAMFFGVTFLLYKEDG